MHMIWDCSQDLLNQAFKTLFMPDGDEKVYTMDTVTMDTDSLKILTVLLISVFMFVISEKDREGSCRETFACIPQCPKAKACRRT